DDTPAPRRCHLHRFRRSCLSTDGRVDAFLRARLLGARAAKTQSRGSYPHADLRSRIILGPDWTRTAARWMGCRCSGVRPCKYRTAATRSDVRPTGGSAPPLTKKPRGYCAPLLIGSIYAEQKA